MSDDTLVLENCKYKDEVKGGGISNDNSCFFTKNEGKKRDKSDNGWFVFCLEFFFRKLFGSKNVSKGGGGDFVIWTNFGEADCQGWGVWLKYHTLSEKGGGRRPKVAKTASADIWITPRLIDIFFHFQSTNKCEKYCIQKCHRHQTTPFFCYFWGISISYIWIKVRGSKTFCLDICFPGAGGSCKTNTSKKFRYVFELTKGGVGD